MGTYSAAKLMPHLPKAWLEVLDMALAVEPGRRYRNTADFQWALPTASRTSKALPSFANETSENVAYAPTKGTEFMSPPAATASSSGSIEVPWLGRKLANKYVLEAELGSGSAGAHNAAA